MSPAPRIRERHHSNGHLAVVDTWRGGERHGPYQAWSPTGALQVEGDFRRGRAHGLWYRYFANGSPRESLCCVAGRRHGPYRQWNEAGQLIVTGAFRADRPVGLWRAYSDLGELLFEAPFSP